MLFYPMSDKLLPIEKILTLLEKNREAIVGFSAELTPTQLRNRKHDDGVTMLTIDKEIARRFILGKQGLWPRRRRRCCASASIATKVSA